MALYDATILLLGAKEYSSQRGRIIYRDSFMAFATSNDPGTKYGVEDMQAAIVMTNLFRTFQGGLDHG